MLRRFVPSAIALVYALTSGEARCGDEPFPFEAPAAAPVHVEHLATAIVNGEQEARLVSLS